MAWHPFRWFRFGGSFRRAGRRPYRPFASLAKLWDALLNWPREVLAWGRWEVPEIFQTPDRPRRRSTVGLDIVLLETRCLMTAGITLTPLTDLVTTEGGGTATFTAVLTAQPTADVFLQLASSNMAEGTVSAAELTFTSLDWSTAQTVTVTGVNDAIDDGNVGFAIQTEATSADQDYDALAVDDVSVTNQDNDTAGVTVSPTADLTTTEAGGSATFTVALTSEPTADVTIPVASADTTEGTVSASTLTFTSLNWNTAQTVTV